MKTSVEATQPATVPLSFTTRPLSDVIGVEIENVDLSRPLDEATIAAIRQAWAAHNIILFRDQTLSVEAQQRFAGYIGPTAGSGFSKHDAYASSNGVLYVSNIRENGKPIGVLPDGEMWFHTDQAYGEKPCAGTMLYAVEVPSRGGNTLFANTTAAYAALPAAIQARLAGLKAMNVYDYTFKTTAPTDASGPEAQKFAHPVVRTHPVTGRKALYVNRLMTAYIEGMPKDESDTLLAMLFDHEEKPEFVYEHVWRKGDLLLWDNRCTLHARTDFPAHERRMLRRIVVLGEKPF